jgi:nickel-dependent lactate racemase
MHFEISLPDAFRPTVAASAPHQLLPSGDLVIGEGIVAIGDRSLAELARPGMRVVIAFTDATRYSPDRLLVGALLRELDRAGVDRDHITLLCAVGLHRPMTDAERVAKLGPELASSLRVIDHNALDPAGLVDLGSIDGIPVVASRLCVEADLLLATGVVEPHQYAGYSGGAKTVVIGCGGEPTIQATHGAAMLDDPGTRLGSVAGNRFQRFIRSAGERVGLDYVVNVLLDESGALVAAAAGEPALVHDHLIARGRGLYQVEVERSAHCAIAGVSPAKGSNLYQASRAATYLALADRTPLLPGAPIILPAAIPEGAGEGTGERRFHEILAAASSPASLVEELRRSGFPAGAQRAYILAKVLAEHPVIVAGAEHPDVVSACHMHAVPGMPEALALAERMAREHFSIPSSAPLDLLVVPNALVTLPTLLRTAMPAGIPVARP